MAISALRRLAIAGATLGAMWLAGLLWFATAPSAEDRAEPTDAIVVLTGGSERLNSGITLLREGKGSKLLVSGVHHHVHLEDLLPSSSDGSEWARVLASCCVVLGYRAGDTLGNADETARWMREEGFHSVRLVTAWYHMRRSLLEFTRAMPGIEIVAHPVFPEQVKHEYWWARRGTAVLLVNEYDKYLAALVRPFLEGFEPAGRGRLARSHTGRASEMRWARALAFNIAFFAWTGIAGTIGLPFLLAPRAAAMKFGRFWARGVLVLLRLIVGLDHQIRGLDRIPRDGCIIAMKHQSAWDALILPVVLGDPACVLKRELLLLPFYGWYAARAGSIAIDRKAGAGALRHLVAAARPVAAQGRPIVIFPEGTRVAPGARLPYQPGVAALYQALALPLVPAAVNSGVFWGRRSFLKRPGRITLEFLEPIPPGWTRRRVMAELEKRVETATTALLREVEAHNGASTHLGFRVRARRGTSAQA